MNGFALVLGGGGYAGTGFHAGVLTALARSGMDARDADVIVGTSAGALAAALIGAGFPPDQYASLVLAEPVSQEARAVLRGLRSPPPAPRMRLPRPVPASPALLLDGVRHPGRHPWGVLRAAAAPRGAVAVDSVSAGMGRAFEHWPDRQVWITAVDLSSGRRAVFGRTDTATVQQAVSASVAIPGFFEPVVIDGVPYVDGGAWSTHSADLVAELDVDLVLISAPSSTDSWVPAPDNLRRIPQRRALAAEVAALRATGKDVVVLAPDRRVRALVGLHSMSLPRRRPVALAALGLAARTIREAGLR